MVWPLRSTLVTGASPLLRASPPTHSASVLSTSQFLLLGGLPLAASGGRIRAGLPTFHAAAADQARVAFMPDTTWPISGHPPGEVVPVFVELEVAVPHL